MIKPKMKPERILVTGANGFIGKKLTIALLEQGFHVIGMDKNTINDARLRAHKNFQAVLTDLNDFSKLLRILKRHKTIGIFHTAALLPQTRVHSPLEFFRTNVLGTANLLEAARESGVKKFIHSSSMSVFDKSASHLAVKETATAAATEAYGFSKLLAEKIVLFYAKDFGIRAVILRYAGVYGPERRNGVIADFFASALKNQTLLLKNNLAWDMICVADVVDANLRAYRKVNQLHSEIIHIGSGRATVLKNLAQLIIKIARSPSAIKFANQYPTHPIFQFSFDITKAKKLLNFKPTPLAKALREYYHALISNRKL